LCIVGLEGLTGSTDPPMANQASLAYHPAMQKFFAPEAVAAAPASTPRFEEDLPAMAAQAYVLADRHCAHCRNFHALWPYRRLARMCSAAEFGAPIIERTIRTLLSAGGRRVLIAAAADSGLLATVARAGAGLEPDITVVDRCETPLELNRQFAAQCSFPVQTQRLDLTKLDLQGFDIIYGNEILQHFTNDQRVDVLARMKQALRPGGHLVCVFHTGGRIEGDIVSEYRSGYADWLLTELERNEIPLPDSRDMFRQCANECASGLQTREGAFEEPEAVDRMMENAGFVVKDRTQFAMQLSESYQNFFAKLGKRRFLLVSQSPKLRD
jgi:SAM-dependent methyltransferase